MHLADYIQEIVTVETHGNASLQKSTTRKCRNSVLLKTEIKDFFNIFQNVPKFYLLCELL